jgi:uncharacterized protein YutE (UPF0331/DUF86 family)
MSEVERRLRLRTMLPTELSYDPFQSVDSMKKLLSDLTRLVLEKKVHHRVAGCCRALVHEYVTIDTYAVLQALEKRVADLEASRGVKAG